jgi:diketogulonate reductase-like aldo/keto reductase
MTNTMNHPMTTMLHDTVEMPMHGLGVFQTPDGDDVKNAVIWAIEDGYRLIDTAAIYRNEVGVGAAVKESGIPRRELFITTKLWNSEQGYESGLRALESSLDKLGMEYVDLYLIHWPIGSKTEDSWKALEKLQSDGLTRAIGVSNFHSPQLDALMSRASVAPSVNQVELHPNLQQKVVVEANDRIGAVTQAWSPLKQARVLDDETLVRIAQQHGVTPAQVVLRWQLQSGIATIPKSVHKHRIIENGDVFSFELTDDDLMSISALDSGDRIGPNPDDHPEGFKND